MQPLTIAAIVVSSPAFNLLFIFSCLLYNSTLSRSANKLCLLPTGHCNRHTRDKDACLPVAAIVSSLLVYISNRGMSSNWCNQLFQVNSSFDNVLCVHTHRHKYTTSHVIEGVRHAYLCCICDICCVLERALTSVEYF